MGGQRLSEQASGVYAISPTPFTDEGALDMESAGRLIDFYLEKEVTGITILGVMGEAPKLDASESRKFLEFMLARLEGKLPVIVGVSNPGLDNMKRLADTAMEAGAAGVMVAPMTGISTDDKLYAYFEKVFAALGAQIPVCFQDFPLTTKVETSIPVFNRLVRDFPQLVMLKHEDCPGLDKLSQVRARAASEGLRRLSILVGNGGLYLPQEMARGADGAMTGFAYPEMLVAVVKAYQKGDAERGEDIFDAYLPLVRYEQQPGIGLSIRKEILRRRGVLRSAALRQPGPSLNEGYHRELSSLMDRLERKLGDL